MIKGEYIESFYQGMREPEGYGAFDQDEGPRTIMLSAYHKYLLRCSGGDIEVLASLIMDDVMEQSEAAFELLRHVTSGNITDDTIIEAAQLLIDSNN